MVADVVASAGHLLVGWIDRFPHTVTSGGRATERLLVIEESEFLSGVGNETLPEQATALALGIGDNGARLAALEAVDGVPFPALVHPSAQVSASALLGAGTVVMLLVVVNGAARE